MINAMALLLIVLMFALSGCAATGTSGTSAAVQSKPASLAGPACSSPEWSPTPNYPPFKR